MREVTFTEFMAFKAAFDAARTASANGGATLKATLTVAQAMADSGREHEALDRMNQAQALGVIEFARISAQLNATARAFLGETRRPDESLASFIERINAVINEAAKGNFDPMFAMQARNSLTYNPTAC